MNRYQRTLFSMTLPVVPAALVIAFGLTLAGTGTAQDGDGEVGGVLPAYDAEGQLLLPDDYRRWVFVGSSLGLSYSEGGGGMEMFHHTLMEPTAHEHFRRTGEFRDGTMFVLLLHGQGEGAVPQRRGRFADDIHGVEMAIKDPRHFEDGWAYFGFGGMGGIRDRARAFASDSCYGCHVEHGAHDNVFLQFYPLLREAAPAGSAVRTASYMPAEGGEAAESDLESDRESDLPVALGGLDPVHLTEDREELGKPEIVASHAGYEYHFVSEPTRARFAADPERYSIQNESCPVVPGARIDPGLFHVHEGRIYAFASENCVEDFRANPGDFLDEDDGVAPARAGNEAP